MNTQTIEVEIDASGQVHAVDPRIAIPAGPALLTPREPRSNEAALLAQAALAEDWLRDEEDEAWAHLQPGR